LQTIGALRELTQLSLFYNSLTGALGRHPCTLLEVRAG
jgi:hypothetical protein